MIFITCTTCKRDYELADYLVGMTIVCKACTARIEVRAKPATAIVPAVDSVDQSHQGKGQSAVPTASPASSVTPLPGLVEVLERAELACKNQDYSDALAHLERFLQTAPKATRIFPAHFMRAQCLRFLKRLDEALAAFDCAIQDFRDRAEVERHLLSYEECCFLDDALFLRACVLHDLGRTSEAEIVFQDLAQKPRGVDRFRASAPVHRHQDDSMHMLERIAKARQTAPMARQATSAAPLPSRHEADNSAQDPEHLPRLLQALQQKDTSYRALVEIDERNERGAVDALIALVTRVSIDESTRNHAAKILGRLGDTRALQPLLEILMDSSEYVRSGVAEALGLLGDVCAVTPLLDLIKDQSRPRRHGCAMDKQSACVALGRLRDKRVLQPMQLALNDANRDVRRGAAEALGLLGEPDSVPFLITALNDSASISEVVTALGKLGDGKAFEPLAALVENCTPEKTGMYKSIRYFAAAALGEIREPRCVPFLTKALRDPSDLVRAGAAKGLGLSLDPKGIAPLVRALKDPVTTVQREAADGLDRIRKCLSTKDVQAAVKDEDDAVKRAVARWLTQGLFVFESFEKCGTAVVARWRATEKAFGIQYEALADAVAVIAPEFVLSTEELASAQQGLPSRPKSPDKNIIAAYLRWNACPQTRENPNPYEPLLAIWEHGGHFVAGTYSPEKPEKVLRIMDSTGAERGIWTIDRTMAPGPC